ncbi:MAG: DUF4105 domain-containing protein [Muribaculaceae bacterium]
MKRLLVKILTFCVAFVALGESQVYFVNIYPGNEIYELEGHSAIRIADTHSDIVVSWGEFDFNSPNFVYRFVKGETDYCCAAFIWKPFEEYYRLSGRRVVVHRIDMDSLQTARLQQLIGENLLPANRVYRYNYVKDNCATRPLRLIERALGDTIILPPTRFDSVASEVTFRNIMRHYHRNYPWYQFGIDLALGSGVDYAIEPRQQAFAPVVLDSQLAGATAAGKPLVLDTQVVVDYPADNAVQGPTPWYLTPLCVCWLIFALTLWICIRDMRRGALCRVYHCIFYSISGLMGLLLTFLIFVSIHEATSPNYLYLWLNPLCMIVPLFIWLKKCKIYVFTYQIVNFALLIGMALLWYRLPQSANAAFLPLILADICLSITYLALYKKKLI